MQFGKNLVDIIKSLCSTYHDRFIACSRCWIEKDHAFYDSLLNVVLFTLQRLKTALGDNFFLLMDGEECLKYKMDEIRLLAKIQSSRVT